MKVCSRCGKVISEEDLRVVPWSKKYHHLKYEWFQDDMKYYQVECGPIEEVEKEVTDIDPNIK